MKLRFNIFVSTLFVLALSLPAFSQAVDTVIGQFTNSPAETFVGGVSGDGRFVVFESRGNLDTQNPRNADASNEIFLWDYAQRRIFQITDTKAVLIDPTGSASLFSNIRVEITNTRPTISTDGRYIVFSSNATTNYPGDANFPPVTNATNPGNFDGNSFTVSPSPSPSGTPGDNPLTHDANLEIWFYQIPSYPAVADLSAGDEQPLTYLSPVDANGNPVAGASFFQVTNTVPSQLPRSATSTTGAYIADDNHDASISDNGQAIAFVSSRDLVTGGNTFPNADNNEIFTFNWSGSPGSGSFKQVTTTPRGTVSSPIFSKFPTISGSGLRVAYASNGENQALTSGSCVSTPPSTRNEEVFYADLDAAGTPTSCHQITNTTPSSAGALVNMFDVGRRMSRDGRYIAFDSYADLAGENSGNNYSSFALYLYDTSVSSNNFRRIGPRSDADSAASGGDAHHYPGFTDADAAGVSNTLILATRENIKPDGTIPATASDGLNNDSARPIQIYAYPLNESANTATFKRLTKFPAPNTFFAATRPITSNTRKRTAFNLALTELGTGNQPDLLNEGYYMIVPTATTPPLNVVPTFATGASGLAVLATPTPTPSPTATPTPTPTPSPSPTPQTPEPVLGLSPGILAVLNFPAGSPQPITAKTAVGSNSRSFQLPIELSGVTLTINGVAAGLKSVGPQSITFVVPPFLSSTTTGTTYPLVLNMNGNVIKLDMTIVPTRPDLFSTTNGPGGRAIIYNVINRVPTREPFTVYTIQLRGGRRVQTKLRLYLTGVANADASVISVKIGTVTISGSLIQTGGIQREPGVYTIDFLLPPELRGAGDQPIIVTLNAGGTLFSSRLEDTAPHVTILQ